VGGFPYLHIFHYFVRFWLWLWFWPLWPEFGSHSPSHSLASYSRHF
jgi:hypothetical protein